MMKGRMIGKRGLGEATSNGAQVCHEGWSQGANGADGAAPFDGLRACCPPGMRGADEETRSAFLYVRIGLIADF